MAHGEWEGKTVHDSEVRALFTREVMLSSDWYAARLEAKVRADRRLWERHVSDLSEFLERRSRLQAGELKDMDEQLKQARAELEALQGDDAAKLYAGTLGLDPAFG